LLARATEVELRLVALFFAQELFAQRRLRRNDEDFSFFVNDFRAAGARADEVKGAFAAGFKFHQRAGVNGFAVVQLYKALGGGWPATTGMKK
jgi:hypothetical protein